MMSVEVMVERDAILSCVTNKFTAPMVQQLEAPLSKNELHQALLQMAKASSLGLDGITTEF